MKNIKYRRDLWQLFDEPGAAAEIGVAEGNNSEDMLRWRMRRPGYDGPVVTTLYLVDRWQTVPTQAGDAAFPQEWHDKNLAQVNSRIRPYGNRAVILRGASTEMAHQVDDSALTLLYIDGDHSYDGVMADLLAWTPKVKPGGFVALHDFLTESYQVGQAVREFCAGRYKIEVLEEDAIQDAGCYFQLPC